MAAFGMKTTGLKELDAAFAALKAPTVRNKIIRPAITKACRILKADLKARVAKRSGKLKRAIDFSITHAGGTHRGRNRRASGGEVVGMVGARRGKGGGHFHLVDQGTKPRRNKAGANRGRVVGKKYLEAATKAAASACQRAIAEGVSEGVKREFAKAGK